jgi:hypothetical protein
LIIDACSISLSRGESVFAWKAKKFLAAPVDGSILAAPSYSFLESFLPMQFFFSSSVLSRLADPYLRVLV